MLGRIAVIGLCAWIAGCSSVPLGTMWKLSRMGPEALYEADPEEIRAAVLSEEWFLDGPSFDQGALRAELRSVLHGDRTWEFKLEETSAREAWQLPEPADGQRWRIFRITESELVEFQDLQRRLPDMLERSQSEDDEGGFSLSVQFMSDELEASIERMAEDGVVMRTETIEFRIDLKLAAEDGYFTLLNDHQLEVQLPQDMDIEGQ